ncbi:MAG: oxygen-independent coproporphyrinogen III oxidase, partial [Nitrospirota bacterium]|nr:oxygen-independent coproporphyrinogen III oxidase [Nitrospirota bacterium]
MTKVKLPQGRDRCLTSIKASSDIRCDLSLMNQELLAKYGGPVPRYTSYPTAPHFHPGIDAAAYRRWLGDLPDDAPLSLYLHIPFCHSLCWYCGCHTTVARRHQPVTEYLDLLRREIELVADAARAGHRVSHLHLGGGTPTMLRPDELMRLRETLEEAFDFDADADCAVEIDPRGLERATIDALAAIGINRASIGVQDVTPEVQRAVNRWQPIEVTTQVVGWLRSAGIVAINLDLMYGLPRQTEAHLGATIDAVLDLAPQRIALFGYAHVPWMKRHQRLIDSDTLPGPAERTAQFELATTRLVEAGYVAIGLDHFARADDALVKARQVGGLRRNFQGYTTDAAPALLGFGASAIGSLPQGYVQNAVPLPAYREALRDGRLPAVRGIAIDDEDRIRRAIIERLMCEFRVDLGVICN